MTMELPTTSYWPNIIRRTNAQGPTKPGRVLDWHRIGPMLFMLRSGKYLDVPSSSFFQSVARVLILMCPTYLCICVSILRDYVYGEVSWLYKVWYSCMEHLIVPLFIVWVLIPNPITHSIISWSANKIPSYIFVLSHCILFFSSFHVEHLLFFMAKIILSMISIPFQSWI
jgi:hypothetical protein